MATFIVTNLADSGAGSLRQAILDANAAGGADTIQFQTGLSGTITLAAELLIIDSVTIEGLGADKIAVSGDNTVRVFHIESPADAPITVAISWLTIEKGKATGANGAAVLVQNESVSLDHVAIKSSTADGGGAGGGIYADLAAVNAAAASTFSLTNSSVTGNEANVGGGLRLVGAGAAAALVRDSTFSGNSSGSDGGAIRTDSDLDIQSSTIAGNTSLSGADAGGLWRGGGTTNIVNSIIFGNSLASLGSDGDISGGGGTTNISYSLVGVNYGASNDSNLVGGNPVLGGALLAGGITYFLPDAAGPAANAGDPAYTAATVPTYDQRGFTRVIGGTIDLGAIETASVPSGSAPTPPTGAAAVVAPDPTPPTPPTVGPTVSASFANLLGYRPSPANPLSPTVTTPDGRILPNPLLEQQKAVAALIAKVDSGALTLRQAQDILVDMADATTSVATLNYSFFTGHLPTKDGIAYLVSSPLNPNDLNDGYYAGMSLENRYINFAVNLGTPPGEGAARFAADYGSLSVADAAAKAYGTVFGMAPAAGKIGAILNTATLAYLTALGGGSDIGTKAAIVGYFLAEAAKADIGPLAVSNENFLYDLLDGTAAFGASLDIYLNAGPTRVGLVGTELGL